MILMTLYFVVLFSLKNLYVVANSFYIIQLFKFFHSMMITLLYHWRVNVFYRGDWLTCVYYLPFWIHWTIKINIFNKSYQCEVDTTLQNANVLSNNMYIQQYVYRLPPYSYQFWFLLKNYNQQEILFPSKLLFDNL